MSMDAFWEFKNTCIKLMLEFCVKVSVDGAHLTYNSHLPWIRVLNRNSINSGFYFWYVVYLVLGYILDIFIYDDIISYENF